MAFRACYYPQVLFIRASVTAASAPIAAAATLDVSYGIAYDSVDEAQTGATLLTVVAADGRFASALTGTNPAVFPAATLAVGPPVSFIQVPDSGGGGDNKNLYIGIGIAVAAGVLFCGVGFYCFQKKRPGLLARTDSKRGSEMPTRNFL